MVFFCGWPRGAKWWIKIDQYIFSAVESEIVLVKGITSVEACPIAWIRNNKGRYNWQKKMARNRTKKKNLLDFFLKFRRSDLNTGMVDKELNRLHDGHVKVLIATQREFSCKRSELLISVHSIHFHFDVSVRMRRWCCVCMPNSFTC